PDNRTVGLCKSLPAWFLLCVHGFLHGAAVDVDLNGTDLRSRQKRFSLRHVRVGAPRLGYLVQFELQGDVLVDGLYEAQLKLQVSLPDFVADAVPVSLGGARNGGFI